MTRHFFVGVDGGGTKTIVRLEDEQGTLLGKEIAGPANIRLSIEQAWRSIRGALEKILEPLDLHLGQPQLNLHAGMGLAGCEVEEAFAAFHREAHPFQTLIVSSDSHTACLAAHGGEDGAIIIAGTGVVGYQMIGDQSTKVGGWGFPQDDEGGGAWLGLQATSVTLQWLDGRLPLSGLAQSIYNHFDKNQARFVSWTHQALPTAFATLAPIVIAEANQGDAQAIAIMQKAGLAINRIHEALVAAQPVNSDPLPCALIGGVTPFLLPYLSESLKSRLRLTRLGPDQGAMLLIRSHINKQQVSNG